MVGAIIDKPMLTVKTIVRLDGAIRMGSRNRDYFREEKHKWHIAYIVETAAPQAGRRGGALRRLAHPANSGGRVLNALSPRAGIDGGRSVDDVDRRLRSAGGEHPLPSAQLMCWASGPCRQYRACGRPSGRQCAAGVANKRFAIRRHRRGSRARRNVVCRYGRRKHDAGAHGIGKRVGYYAKAGLGDGPSATGSKRVSAPRIFSSQFIGAEDGSRKSLALPPRRAGTPMRWKATAGCNAGRRDMGGAFDAEIIPLGHRRRDAHP